MAKEIRDRPMFKKERHKGLVAVSILAIRKTSDGLVADLEIWFEGLDQRRLCKAGEGTLFLEGPKKDQALKLGPLWFDLAKLDLPGLEDQIRRAGPCQT